MPMPDQACHWDAHSNIRDGRMGGASEKLFAAVEEQTRRAHQSVRQAVAVLHARGVNVEGFDAVSSRYRCPLPVNLELRVEAVLCDRPWSVEHYPLHSSPSTLVETLVVGDRAGQVVDGDPAWGRWDDGAQRVVTDDGVVLGLDGRAG